MKQIWLYRIAIIWGVLFTLNALATCVAASLLNTKWLALDSQGKFLLVVMVFSNWTGTMIAFLTNTAKKLEQGELPMNGKIPHDETPTTIETKSP